jgi:hypothetical protein
MKTLLDEFQASFLQAAVYANRALRVIVAEGFRAAEPDDITIGTHVIEGAYAIDSSEESRLVEVRFAKPIAWQLVDESFTVWDDYELRDDRSALQDLSQSRYLDYVRANHGWFEEMRGRGKHFRIWTENEVVDVIACAPPSISLTSGV